MARARQLPFMDTAEALALDFRLQETLTFVPPILVRTIPPPSQSPASEFRKSVSAAFALADRHESESNVAIRRGRMRAPNVSLGGQHSAWEIVPLLSYA